MVDRPLLQCLLHHLWPDPLYDELQSPDWPPVNTPYCQRCGTQLGEGLPTEGPCHKCKQKKLPWSLVVRLGPWEPPLSHWIAKCKYQRIWRYANYFGHALGDRIPSSSLPTIVVPVPLHWTRQLDRTFNQAECMSRALAHSKNWSHLHALKRTQRGNRQAASSQSKREKNVRHAFAPTRHAIRHLKAKRVILVDDVMTSGATLRQCCRILKSCEATEIVIAVAATATRF